MKAGLLWIAGLAGLLAGASLVTHRRLQRAQPMEGREPLARWEGEGGGLPQGATSTPQPTSPSHAH